MSKPSHAKRTRPRPTILKRRRIIQRLAAEQRAVRQLEQWRRAG